MGNLYFNDAGVGLGASPVADSKLVHWGLGADEVGERFHAGKYTDAELMVQGTAGGGTIQLQGSVVQDPDPGDDADWYIIEDFQGNELSGLIPTPTLGKGYLIANNSVWMRAITNGGDGTTALKAWVFCVKGA